MIRSMICSKFCVSVPGKATFLSLARKFHVPYPGAMRAVLGFLGIALAMAGCAHRVEKASVEEHERTAEAIEELAVAEEAKYDPNAGETTACMEFCFTTWTNPTEGHLREARRLRRLAEQHREASQDLQVAEARACADIPERDRDISPFFHRADIVAIGFPEKATDPFIIEFTVENTSVEQFHELIGCHLARNASLGYEMPEMDYCPLAVPEVKAEVSGSEDRIRVELRGSDPQARSALHQRLTALVQGETPSS